MLKERDKWRQDANRERAIELLARKDRTELEDAEFEALRFVTHPIKSRLKELRKALKRTAG